MWYVGVLSVGFEEHRWFSYITLVAATQMNHPVTKWSNDKTT